jgi:glycosyltransferase involved in cell wall biosynthesis
MTAKNSYESSLVSIIVPLYNEEDNVRPMFEAIRSALDNSTYRYEIIFVDDGSTDATARVASELASSEARLYLLKLRRNYGQTPAMSAGIDFAHGDTLVTLDGDLQNDPRDIVRLVREVEQGADLAVGWREKRKDHKWSRIIPSRIANRLIASVTGIPIRDNGCSLKAYRASVIKQIPLYSEMHRFIPAMASIAGARVRQIPVRHHERKFGESKYGIGRTWRVLFDLLSIKTIVAFSSRPLLWFSALAFVPGVLALGFGTYALLEYVQGGSKSDVVSTGIALQFFALATFLGACGVIAELVFRVGDTREHRFAALTANGLATAAPAGKVIRISDSTEGNRS